MEAGLALGVTEFDPLLPTMLFTQSGVQKMALDAAAPEDMRKSNASPGKGKRGWLKSVQRLHQKAGGGVGEGGGVSRGLRLEARPFGLRHQEQGGHSC